MADMGLNWLMNPAMGSLPILVILVVLVFIVGFAYIYKARLLFFKWSRAVSAPCVMNYEGGSMVATRDKFRKTEKDGRTFFESKEFGDRIDATDLMAHARYTKDRLGRWVLEMLPLVRYNGEWTTLDWERDAQGKVIAKQLFTSEAKMAQATMTKDNEDFLTSDTWWQKWGGMVSVGVVGVIMIISLVVITQFVGGVITTSTNQLAVATNALVATINCSASQAATPIPPPNGGR